MKLESNRSEREVREISYVNNNSHFNCKIGISSSSRACESCFQWCRTGIPVSEIDAGQNWIRLIHLLVRLQFDFTNDSRVTNASRIFVPSSGLSTLMIDPWNIDLLLIKMGLTGRSEKTDLLWNVNCDQIKECWHYIAKRPLRLKLRNTTFFADFSIITMSPGIKLWNVHGILCGLSARYKNNTLVTLGS